MNESPFEFETVPVLPACSRRTLRLLADDEEYCRAVARSRGCSESTFQRAFARVSSEQRIRDMIEATRAIAQHLRAANRLQVELILSSN